ncbi:MAG: rsmG [Devosia sp.]|uniref:16S rRNA (guanine(527)-N(7))-methyltransferase RsmG n=1 Tax=Devosia sp. TaxID=1871048 RepID=UPI0026290D0A|nr:16S rRNA (guanine(527)-N(7))-methyltransferase RsmG [Devosia sp.]MDB5586851.1 rsmG [Devosia sp.]
MQEHEQAISAYAEYLSRPVYEVAADLESYARLLRKWQKVQNLVSRETLDAVWTRHFADSLQVLKLLRPTDRLIVDMGSGGGFPALPLAIALKGVLVKFVLVEPNGRKVSFLRTVARELGLAVTVESRRSNELDSRETGAVDVITARALASLNELCAMARPLFGPQTRAIFHKGREHLEELAESRLVWDHDVVILPSDTDPNGVLLELSNLSLKNR